MPTQASSGPVIARTIPPPITVPTRPIATVSHAGIGSGPGTAKRASAPVMKAEARAAMTLPSTGLRLAGQNRPMGTTPAAPFIHALRLGAPQGLDYTDDLPALRPAERIELHPRVTFFVGENGSGKSTLVEALAAVLKLNVEGGGRV